MKKKFLAAKLALVVALSGTAMVTPVQAGIPVIDGTNLEQNIMTAIESVAQTLKQIEQYQTQLQQYENQLQNTMAPAAYIWDQAQSTINSLMNAVNTLDYYKSQLGSLDNYINKFQDVSYYRGSPCFSVAGCSDAEWAAMKSVEQVASASQKKANDALFRGLDQQQTNLRNDAAQLQRLQSAAQGANGQMQALGFANQLASLQANQLLQIRGLLIAQQNAVTTRMQAQADKESREAAAAAQLRQGSFRASPARAW
ncbi:TPA: P-type conjugative transfer protein TrbJ [Escherichia coli]|nr:P-type conjugative transfer protein TrbJ [Escherichia coli]